MGTTTNYGWTTPTVGGSTDTWGTTVNAAFEAADASLKTVSDAKQPLDSDLTAIAALGYTSGAYLVKKTAANTYSLIALTSAGEALLDDANAAAQRTTLGLGTAAVVNTGTSGTAVPLLDGSNVWSLVQSFSATDAPVEINSTNSNAAKLTWRDNGNIRGYMGASSANCFIANDSIGGVAFRVDQSGNAVATGTVTGTSDQSLKTNVRDLEDTLRSVLALEPRRFSWKDGRKACEIGLIAQEVEAVRPEYVLTDPETGLKSVAYGNIVCDLIGAVKALAAR